MTPEQKKYFNVMMAGPVSGTGSAGVVQRATAVWAQLSMSTCVDPAIAAQMTEGKRPTGRPLTACCQIN